MEMSMNETGLDNNLSDEPTVNRDDLTEEEKTEYDVITSWIDTILDYPPEKRVELLKKYHLENHHPLFRNIMENNGEYKKQIQTMSELKTEFLDNIGKEDIGNELDNITKRSVIKDHIFVGILSECFLTRDEGYRVLEEDGLYYTYFMDRKSTRKYISDKLGYIQVYGRSGLYNVNSKTLDDYKKSKDILKRVKVLQIKNVKDKETYSFECLDKTYFIDDMNKNYKLTWNPNKDKMYLQNRVNYYNEFSPIQYQGIDHGKDLSLIYFPCARSKTTAFRRLALSKY